MMDSVKLDDMELYALRIPQGLIAQFLGECVTEIRNLQHDLRNPNYLYSGSRIHRQSIICRNCELAQKDVEIKNLKEQIDKLKNQLPKPDTQTVQAKALLEQQG